HRGQNSKTVCPAHTEQHSRNQSRRLKAAAGKTACSTGQVKMSARAPDAIQESVFAVSMKRDWRRIWDGYRHAKVPAVQTSLQPIGSSPSVARSVRGAVGK